MRDALKYLILTNVPPETLVEIEDDDTKFENVTPLEMMDHLRTNARITNVFDKKQLLDALHKPIDFDGDLPLKGHFKNVDVSIKQLMKHNINASKSIIMVTLLEQIKGRGDFKEEVIKWELKPAAMQTWVEFKKYFSAADHKRRQWDQYRAKTACTSGATANQVQTIADFKTDIDENLLALAHATTTGLNAVMEKPAPKATTKASTTTTAESLAEKVTALKAKLKRMKATKSTNKTKGDNTNKPPRVKCTHCNRYHPKIPADKCWALPANQATKPEGWTPLGEKSKQD